MFWILNRNSFFFRLTAFFLSLILTSLPALSCPCGCGSHSPLELNSIDQFKYRISTTREFAPSSYRNSGERSDFSSPLMSVETIELSGIYALTPKFSSFLQLGVKRNSGNQESHYSAADPSFGLSWTFYETYLSETKLSLKSTLSFKVPYAPSVYDKAYDLHNFSNGFWETSPGLGASLTYLNWAFLLNEKLIFRKARGLDDPGLINKLSLGLAYTFFSKGMVSASLEQELRRSDSLQGKVLSQAKVARYSHSFLWALQGRVGDRKTLELNGSHPLPLQKNSMTYHQLSLSFSQAV